MAISELSEDDSSVTQGSKYTQGLTGHQLSERKCSYGYSLGCAFQCRTIYSPTTNETLLQVIIIKDPLIALSHFIVFTSTRL